MTEAFITRRKRQPRCIFIDIIGPYSFGITGQHSAFLPWYLLQLSCMTGEAVAPPWRGSSDWAGCRATVGPRPFVPGSGALAAELGTSRMPS